MQMLWADDVQMSDLKDDVKNAQRLLNERKKLTVSPSTPFRTDERSPFEPAPNQTKRTLGSQTEIFRRRIQHQEGIGKGPGEGGRGEDYNQLIRSILPHRMAELVTNTQSMRDERDFGHLKG